MEPVVGGMPASLRGCERLRTVADVADDYLGAVLRPVRADVFATGVVYVPDLASRQWWKRRGGTGKR